MFLDVASTHTKCILNDFALAPRTDLLNFECHTVTNGTDLRKSPLLIFAVATASYNGLVERCRELEREREELQMEVTELGEQMGKVKFLDTPTTSPDVTSTEEVVVNLANVRSYEDGEQRSQPPIFWTDICTKSE